MSRRKPKRWVPPSGESVARMYIESPEMGVQHGEMDLYLKAGRAFRQRHLKRRPNMNTDTWLYSDMVLAAESLALVYLSSESHPEVQREIEYLVDTQFRRIFEQNLYMLRPQTEENT